MGGPWEQYQSATPQPSTSLPAPGDPTSFTGSSAAGTTMPSRLSPDTMRAFAIDLMANGGKGASSILTQDPGTQAAKAYATTEAGNQANLNFKQKMTAPMLDIIHGMRAKLDEAGPTIADMATGPDYGALSDDPSFLERTFKSLLPDTSGEFYQNARAALSSDPNAGPARDLNLELHHLTKGIGGAVKSIPGTKNGGTSTDADQALVLDAVGEAMHASNAPTRNGILFDAENILRARAGQPMLPTPPGYQPSYLIKKYGTPPGPQGMPTPQASGAPPAVPAPGATTAPQPSPTPQQAPVKVMSPNQALALPPGTRFMTPDGRIKVRP